MNLALAPDLEELIDEQLAHGRLQTPDEVMREALLLLKRTETDDPPRPQQVRLAGRLDTLRCEERCFELVLGSGERIEGRSAGLEPSEIRGLLGEAVVVSGLGFFRPSGDLERLDAELIEPAQGDVSFWSHPPRSVFAHADPRDFDRPQDPSRLREIFGEWPGDESDEEVFAALEELS